MRSRFHEPRRIMALIESQGFTPRIEGYHLFRAWIVADKP